MGNYLEDLHDSKVKVYGCYLGGHKCGCVESDSKEDAEQKAVFKYGMEVDIVLRGES